MKIITLLRKPLEGTVADNTLKHGCGGINIDATRVGTEVMTSIAMGSLGVMHDDGWVSKPIDPIESTGRWPANFILTHLDGCTLQGDDWICIAGCPVRELDQQSGVSKSTGGRIHNKQGAFSFQGSTGYKDIATKGDPGFGDVGGASRFFMCFQEEPPAPKDDSK